MSDLARSAAPTIVFGGTFDPPHRAHVTMASAAADLLHAKAILVVPAAINPQRVQGRPPAPATDRLAMASIAFRDEPRARVLDIEIARGGASYTIDTLEALLAPETRGEHEPLRLLVGSDQALNLPTWRRWEEVIRLAPPAIVVRPPHSHETFRAALVERFGERAAAWQAWVLPMAPVDLSATAIRDRLRADDGSSAGLDLAVAEYIRSRGLYVS